MYAEDRPQGEEEYYDYEENDEENSGIKENEFRQSPEKEQVEEEVTLQGGITESSTTPKDPSPSLTASTKSSTKSPKLPLMGVMGDQDSHSAVGTLQFMAPEVVQKKKYAYPIDWWACGVTFYQCVTREKLFNGQKADIIKQICKGDLDFSKATEQSPSLTRLLERLLDRDPSERLGTHGVTEVTESDFFADLSTTRPSFHIPNILTSTDDACPDQEARELFYGTTDEQSDDNFPISQHSTGPDATFRNGKYISKKFSRDPARNKRRFKKKGKGTGSFSSFRSDISPVLEGSESGQFSDEPSSLQISLSQTQSKAAEGKDEKKE